MPARRHRPRSGRPQIGSPRLHQRIRRLLGQPKAWTIGRLYQRLGRPAISLRTPHRRVGEVAAWRRPRLVAKGDPDRDQILADLHQTIVELPAGAVLPAEDETHINLLSWARATWIVRGTRQQVMTPGNMMKLEEYQRLLNAISQPVSDEEAEALARLFGPDDCFGLAWTLVHLIESAPGWPLVDRLPAIDNEWIVLLRDRSGRGA